MTKIKICGITRPEDALVAADAGADFLGFVFVPGSPRHVEPERAAAIVTLARARNRHTRMVGVFRDASVDYMAEIANVVGLDLLQFHGSESDEDIEGVGMPVIKAFRVRDALPDTRCAAAWLLFDTFEEGRAGGTGRRFDWSLLSDYPHTKPFFLAGGLAPDNVAEAIRVAQPDAIDVSSGVEFESGVKDHAKVRSLIEQVRGG